MTEATNACQFRLRDLLAAFVAGVLVTIGASIIGVSDMRDRQSFARRLTEQGSAQQHRSHVVKVMSASRASGAMSNWVTVPKFLFELDERGYIKVDYLKVKRFAFDVGTAQSSPSFRGMFTRGTYRKGWMDGAGSDMHVIMVEANRYNSETISLLRKSGYRGLVMGLTGCEGVSDNNQMIAAGAHDVLVKGPAVFKAIRTMLEEVLGGT